VHWLLASPLHALAGKNMALITVTGRRTGREYTMPVAFKQEGDSVDIHVGWAERKTWWRNLRSEAPVRMRIQGVERTGRGRAVEDERTGVHVQVTLDPG
jgi:F420H(2)-dependent quinone reductase